MPNYIVNTGTSANGNHDVHDENSMCGHLPHPDQRRSLGWFSNGQNAIAEARKTFPSVEGCNQCIQA